MALPKRTAVLLTILAVLVAIALLLFYRLKYYPNNLSQEVGSQRQKLQTTLSPPQASPSPTASPSPKAIKQGPETYTVSQPSSHQGPTITKASLNPHDPKLNQTQTIEVTVKNPSDVNSVTITFFSDNNQVQLPLTLESGTNKDGVWSVTHTVTDTVLYRYMVSIQAQGANGTSQVDLTIR